MQRQTVLRLVMASIGLIFGFLALEAGLRLKVASDNFRVRQADLGPPPTGKVLEGQIIKFCPNPRLIYDFRPNLNVEFKGVNVKTNAEGFRDVDHKVEKPAGVKRLIGLGDSFAFGWGVPFEDCYLSVAQAHLPGWEVFNFGRFGYGTCQELEALKVYGLKYKPDVVVINYIGNDKDLPNMIQKSPTDMGSCFVWDFLRGRFPENGLIHTPFVKTPSGLVFESDPKLVPPQYRDMVGYEAVRKAFLELAELGRQHNFRPILFCYPHAVDEPLQFAREAGLEICDYSSELKRLTLERGIKDGNYVGTDLTLAPPDPHPSVLLHRLGGEFLARHVQLPAKTPARP